MSSEDDEVPGLPPEISLSEVDGDLMRELLLSEIAVMRARQEAGKAVDVFKLEKLLELVKDFPALAKAVDDLQECKHDEAPAETTPAPETTVTLRKLRAVLGK